MQQPWHKLGHIPYPAGVISFKNNVVTELLAQRAQYISDEGTGINNINENIKIHSIGHAILEGSKPGASAISCWLTHKTIPLNSSGHGKIVSEALLNAKILAYYLSNHKVYFANIEYDVYKKNDKSSRPFTFKNITYHPDTSIVCYIAKPMIWKNNKLSNVDFTLKQLNELNVKIYESLSIKDNQKRIHTQDFFVSITRLEKEQYEYNSIKDLLEDLNIKEEEYNEEGLFVLRSTVMNPWYEEAKAENFDILYEFIKSLHKHTKKALSDI